MQAAGTPVRCAPSPAACTQPRSPARAASRAPALRRRSDTQRLRRCHARGLLGKDWEVADEGSGVSLPSNPPSEARDVALLGACPLAAPCAPPLPGPAGAVAANPFGIQARLDLSTHLRLDQVRAQLLRQEDSILFGWLRRAAYRRNQAVYAPRGMEALLPPSDAHGRGQSLLEWHLEQTEVLHARIRRYTSPDEHPFFPAALPPPVLPPLTYGFSPLPRYADEISVNDAVLAAYLHSVLPAVADPGDDHNYGSTVLCDVQALQTLSKRIHFGKFVAEAKFRAQRALFEPLIAAGDAAAVLAALTHPDQEDAVAQRVARKAGSFAASVREAAAGGGEAAAAAEVACRLSPEAASRLWVDLVMPLTKQVQVAYLLRRLEATPAEEGEGRFAEGQARGRGPLGGFI